jgi:predicted nucleic acid-binding protein
MAYLDSSALVKTVIREPESVVLRRYLRTFSVHTSSELAVPEVLRAIRRSDATATPKAHQALRGIVILDLTKDILVEAGMLDPPELRTLDAVHVATARTLGDELVAVVTYDDRMAAAAARVGLPVATPA